MLRRVLFSRASITWVAVGNGVFFGFYLGMYFAGQDPWDPWRLLGVLVFGTALACGLITLFQKSRWGEDGMLKFRRTRFNSRWMRDEGHDEGLEKT